MTDERDDLPRGVCPKCGDAFEDLDNRRGSEVRCHCGAKIIVASPRLHEEPRWRYPD